VFPSPTLHSPSCLFSFPLLFFHFKGLNNFSIRRITLRS
jgi:hypothetical protein